MNPKTSRIEFVYFDLGNLLLEFDPAIACRNVAERFEVAIDDARVAVYENGLQDRFEHGQCTGEQFVDEVRSQLLRSESEMSTAGILDAISDMFTAIDTMRGVPQRVRACGYGVGILSNTCTAHWDWIARQKYDVMDFSCDATILSFEVGSMKPAEPIYIAAEKGAGVPADRILFLDDKAENTAAARRRGWNAVTCLGGDAAIDALRSFGVMGEEP